MTLKRLLQFAALLVVGWTLAVPSAPPALTRAAHAAEGDEAPPPARRKFRRSKLTNDESEMTADRRRLLLSTGEDKAIDLDFDVHAEKGVSVGNPKLLAFQLVKIGEKRQLVLKPFDKSGETTVTLRDTDGMLRLILSVKVTVSNLSRLAAEIRELLRDVEGLNIKIVGSKVVLDGELLVPADYGRLLTVIGGDKAYAENVINLTTLSPLSLQVIAKRIETDIHAFAPNVTTRVVNGVIFLEGTVDNRSQGVRAKEVASLYLPEPRPGDQLVAHDPGAQIVRRQMIQNFIVENPPPPKKQEKLVRITVHYVELSKDYNKVFGFKWQPGFTADPQIAIGTNAEGAQGGNSASFSATISSLLPKLKSAQTAGYARILRTGTVVVRSGQEAKILEQTQIPYLTAGPNGTQNAAAQNIGLSIVVSPQILGQSEDILMNLDLDQSGVVSKAGDQNMAITSVHKVKTSIYVKSNESAAVAGVQSADVGTNFNTDDPKSGTFGDNTDPLFTLMRSKAYRKKKSQYVVFITPQIIENASEGTEDLKKNFRVKAK